MENWSLSKIILTISALAVVAGASFLYSTTRNDETILDESPELIQNINPNKDPFKGDGPGQPGGVSVVPTEIIAQNALEGVELPDIVVRNGSQTKQTLQIDFVPVERQTAGGSPDIIVDQEKIRAGREILQLDKRRITLSPGEETTIGSRVIGSDDRPMVVGAISIRFVSSKSELALPEGKNVNVTVQNTPAVASMVYLLFENQDSEKVSLQGILARTERDENNKQVVRFFAAVRSDNDFLSTPKGIVTVTRSNGERVAEIPFLGDQNILPRQISEIATLRGIKLQPGQYQLEARVVSGDSGQALRRNLEIASNGEPAEVEASALIETGFVRVLPGSDYPVQLQVLNSGNKPFAPRGKVALYRLGSRKALDEKEINIEAISPGDPGIQDFSFVAPETKGRYAIIAQIYDQQDKFLVEASAGMEVATNGVAEKTFSIKFRDWLSDNPLRSVALGIVLFGILAAGIVGAIALLGRLRSRRS